MKIKTFYMGIIAVFLLVVNSCDSSENDIESLTEFSEMEIEAKESKTKSIKLPESGSALYFNGVDNFIVVQDHESLDLTAAFTIAAWIYIEHYQEWASILTKGVFNNNYTIHQSGPDFGGSPFGLLRFTGDTSFPFGLPESSTVIPLMEWTYVAVSFDGETISFYHNGELDAEMEQAGPLGTNNEPLIIGADFPGSAEFWHGCIDEVRIWNQSLKQIHIKAAMTGHASPLASALVAYWRFDEGEGNVVHDKSKNKHHGTIHGIPYWINAND